MPRYLVLDRVQSSDGRRKGVILKLDSYIPSDYRSQHYQVEWDSGARNWYDHYQLLPYTKEQEDLDNRLQASAAVAPPLPPVPPMAAPTRRTRRSAAQILAEGQSVPQATAEMVAEAQRVSDEYWAINTDRILQTDAMTSPVLQAIETFNVQHMPEPEPQPPEMYIREVPQGWTGETREEANASWQAAAEMGTHPRGSIQNPMNAVEFSRWLESEDFGASASVPVDQVQFSEVEYNDPTVW